MRDPMIYVTSQSCKRQKSEAKIRNPSKYNNPKSRATTPTRKKKTKNKSVPNKNKANEPTENCLANIFLVVPNILAGKSCGVYCFFLLLASKPTIYNRLFPKVRTSRSLLCVELEELSLRGREEELAPDPGKAKRTPPLMSPNSKLVLRIPEAELCYSKDADVTEEAPTWRWRSRLYHRPGAGEGEPPSGPSSLTPKPPSPRRPACEEPEICRTVGKYCGFEGFLWAKAGKSRGELTPSPPLPRSSGKARSSNSENWALLILRTGVLRSGDARSF